MHFFGILQYLIKIRFLIFQEIQKIKDEYKTCMY
jgi:hypothetical protein